MLNMADTTKWNTLYSDDSEEWESDVDWESENDSHVIDPEIKNLLDKVNQYGEKRLIKISNMTSRRSENIRLRKMVSKIRFDIEIIYNEEDGGDKDKKKDKRRRMKVLKKEIKTIKEKIDKNNKYDIYYLKCNNEIKYKIKDELARFNAIASYFETQESLMEYLKSDFTSFFAPLQCGYEMAKAFFEDSDQDYDPETDNLDVDCIENVKIMRCNLMKEDKYYLSFAFNIDLPTGKGNKDVLIKNIVKHYYGV